MREEDFKKNTETPTLPDYESGTAKYKGIRVTYEKIGNVVTIIYVIKENQRKRITSLPYPLKRKNIKNKGKKNEH